MAALNTPEDSFQSSSDGIDPVCGVASDLARAVPSAEFVGAHDAADAIEVAAVFDGTVMTVRHFERAQAGRQRWMTRGLLVGAAFAFLSLGALFADSYSQGAAERAAQEAGIPLPRAAVQGVSAMARDAVAGGLLFAGLAALFWGLQRAASARRDREFTIGSAAGATFHIAAERLPLLRFPILRAKGRGYEVLFCDSMEGDLQTASTSTSLHDLRDRYVARPVAGLRGAFALPLPEGGQLRLLHAGCTFLLRSVEPIRHRLPSPRFDWRTHSYTAVLLLGAVSLLGVMFALPPTPRSLEVDVSRNDLLLQFLLRQPEEKEERSPWIKQDSQESFAERRRFDFVGRFVVDFGPMDDDSGAAPVGLGPISTLRTCDSGPGCGTAVPVSQIGQPSKPSVWSLGQPQVMGSLDGALVRRVVQRHLSEVKFCYERELTRDASLSGRLVVKFAVGGAGQVLASAIESSTIANEVGARCIRDAVRRWQFHKPQAGVAVVTYPFLLRAEGGESRAKTGPGRLLSRAPRARLRSAL